MAKLKLKEKDKFILYLQTLRVHLVETLAQIDQYCDRLDKKEGKK